jgi:large subunit ribosomal protein L21
MSYAVIKTGGKQYRVSEGDTITVEKLPEQPGTKITFNEVLLVGEGDSIRVGRPTVQGASVSGEILDQIKGDKVIAFKFKRRKGYHRTVGHRQKLTKVKISTIKG